MREQKTIHIRTRSLNDDTAISTHYVMQLYITPQLELDQHIQT